MAIKQIESTDQASKVMADSLNVFYLEDGEYKEVMITSVYDKGDVELLFQDEFNHLLNHNRQITVEIGDERLVFEE